MSSLPELPPLLLALHDCILDSHSDSAEDHSYCKDEEVLQIQKGGFGGHKTKNEHELKCFFLRTFSNGLHCPHIV